jgi:hypothetical protein
MTFELFVRRKERLTLIEKLGTNISPVDSNIFKMQFSSLLPTYRGKSFMGLRIGCLLVGLGIGLLAGFFLHILVITEFHPDNWRVHELISVAYGAPVMLFGGLGLIVSFIVEKNLSQKKGDDAD